MRPGKRETDLQRLERWVGCYCGCLGICTVLRCRQQIYTTHTYLEVNPVRKHVWGVNTFPCLHQCFSASGTLAVRDARSSPSPMPPPLVTVTNVN